MKRLIIIAFSACLAYCAAPPSSTPVSVVPPPVVAPPTTPATVPPTSAPAPAPPPPTRPPIIVPPPTPPPPVIVPTCNEPVVVTVVPANPIIPGSQPSETCSQCGKPVSCTTEPQTIPAASGNCVNLKCGNLGTKVYTADILPLTPPNYQVKYIFFFPNADEKSGLCMDTTMIQYNGKGHWPAGYTIASMYNNRPAPTLGNGQIETCNGSGQDGGICFHRFAGIVEWDSWMIFKIDPITGKGVWATSAAYAYFGKVMGSAAAKLMIDNATNTFLAKYGKYMKPPCLKLPCA